VIQSKATIETSLSRLMVAHHQVGENMTCRVSTRMAKLGFDSQKAVVKTYTLMLYLLGAHPAPTR
jgi:hypothetical protein